MTRTVKLLGPDGYGPAMGAAFLPSFIGNLRHIGPRRTVMATMNISPPDPMKG
jgi:hypothetical protein